MLDAEALDRIRAVRSRALARLDLSVVRECDLALDRELGRHPAPAPVVEEAVPEVRERAVAHRRRR